MLKNHATVMMWRGCDLNAIEVAVHLLSCLRSTSMENGALAFPLLSIHIHYLFFIIL